MSSGRRLAAWAVVAALVACARRPGPAGLSAATHSAGAREAQQLPPGEGRELVLGSCLICHGAGLIMQQHKDMAAWTRTVTQMVTWGAPVAAEQQQQLIAYLARHYGR